MPNIYHFDSGKANIDKAVTIFSQNGNDWMTAESSLGGHVCFLLAQNGGDPMEIPDENEEDWVWNLWLPDGVTKAEFLKLIKKYNIYD